MATYTPLSNVTAGGDSLQIIDPVLSQIAVQFRPHGFAYSQLVNNFPVEFNVGQYPEFNRAGFFASGDGRPVPDDATTPLVEFESSEEFYHCKDYRKRVRLTRKELQQAHPALRITESKVIGLLDMFAGEREKRLAEKLFPKSASGAPGSAALTANSGKTIEATENWNASSGTEIQKDVQEAMKAVYASTGIWPNTMVLTKQVALAVANNPKIKEQLQYVYGMEMLREGWGILPKELFGLKVIEIDGALTNTAAAGEAANLAEIWGDFVRILYVNSNPTWGVPSVAYGFRGKVTDGFSYATPAVAEGGPGGVTQQEPGGMAQWTVVDRWAEPDPPAENIRVWECVDEKIVAPELGAVISGKGSETKGVLGETSPK